MKRPAHSKGWAFFEGESMTQARDLITEKFGISTHSNINPLLDQVGTAVVQILKNDPNRVALTMFNLSTNIVYVLPDESVAATKAIRLAPSGGAVALNIFDDFDMVTRSWHALASGAASDVMISETLITN